MTNAGIEVNRIAIAAGTAGLAKARLLSANQAGPYTYNTISITIASMLKVQTVGNDNFL